MSLCVTLETQDLNACQREDFFHNLSFLFRNHGDTQNEICKEEDDGRAKKETRAFFAPSREIRFLENENTGDKKGVEAPFLLALLRHLFSWKKVQSQCFAYYTSTTRRERMKKERG